MTNVYDGVKLFHVKKEGKAKPTVGRKGLKHINSFKKIRRGYSTASVDPNSPRNQSPRTYTYQVSPKVKRSKHESDKEGKTRTRRKNLQRSQSRTVVTDYSTQL